MNRFYLGLACLLISPFALAEAWPVAEYGVAKTFYFKLYNTDGTLDVDEADGGAEVTVDCDGTPATATNDFADEGAFYSIALTAAEMQCGVVVLTIAATDTEVFIVPTSGNASAYIDDDGGWYDAIPYNSAWDADIESEASDAAVALHLDHLLAADYDPASKPGTATALFNELVESDGGVSRYTANALEQAPSGSGGGTTYAQIYKVDGITSVILSACVSPITGSGFLHVDEDVANLSISVLDEQSVQLALYDAGAEIEDVVTPGTGAWTTPSANNVRASPDGNADDCTELQFLDTVFASDDIAWLRISDGQTTIKDYVGQITFLATEVSSRASMQAELEEMKLHKLFLSAVSGTDVTDNSAWACLFSDDATCDYDSADNATDSLEAISNKIGTPTVSDLSSEIADIGVTTADNGTEIGNIQITLGTAGDGLTDIPGIGAFNPINTSIATLASQDSFTLTAGSTDSNAYNGCSAMITDQATATQIAFAGIRDYDGGTKTITLHYDPGVFTMATTDLVSISCGPVMR